MKIINYIQTRGGNKYFCRGSIHFTQGGQIGAEFIDVRNSKEIFIDAGYIDIIGICSEIESENVPFLIENNKQINITGDFPY